jgi:hypothetical protein
MHFSGIFLLVPSFMPWHNINIFTFHAHVVSFFILLVSRFHFNVRYKGEE